MYRPNAELYKSLLDSRIKLGDESGFMPYMVASNRTLLFMATEMPQSLERLKRVEGMTEAKIKKFGSQFVGHIVNFCKGSKLSESYSDQPFPSDPQPSTSKEPQYSKSTEIVDDTGWLSRPKVSTKMSNGPGKNIKASMCLTSSSAITEEMEVEGEDKKDDHVEEKKVHNKAETSFNPSIFLHRSKSKRGVQFDCDGDDEEESEDQKYERIHAENKRKLENTGWISAKHMKSKMKKNSLFKKTFLFQLQDDEGNYMLNFETALTF
ncbi:hypothetical protein Avbf_09576 [Armadillidium vulgare]|nr:hypothetical protein Avbf_09576 [Armadillidium vulgare]